MWIIHSQRWASPWKKLTYASNVNLPEMLLLKKIQRKNIFHCFGLRLLIKKFSSTEFKRVKFYTPVKIKFVPMSTTNIYAVPICVFYRNIKVILFLTDNPQKPLTCTCPKLIKHPFVKYFGLTIDQYFKWNMHIDNLIIKLRQLKHFFIIAKNILNKNYLRTTYFAISDSIRDNSLGWLQQHFKI